MSTRSFTCLFVLQAVAQGRKFGFDIMGVTSLPNGTVYPALRTLESEALVHARPRRRYYELTATGTAQLAEADSRFRAVSKLFPKWGRS